METTTTPPISGTRQNHPRMTTPPNSNLPPTTIPPQTADLPGALGSLLTDPTAVRFPLTWRCGACATLHDTLGLMMMTGSSPTSSKSTTTKTKTTATMTTTTTTDTCCAAPSLQAVYDQFGELYLFWRDDPAVADLSVPRMADEARWRLWRAGGDGWEAVLGGLGVGDGGDGMILDGDKKEWEGGERRVGPLLRPGRGMSQSSARSDGSEDSMGAVYAMEA